MKFKKYTRYYSCPMCLMQWKKEFVSMIDEISMDDEVCCLDCECRINDDKIEDIEVANDKHVQNVLSAALNHYKKDLDKLI